MNNRADGVDRKKLLKLLTQVFVFLVYFLTSFFKFFFILLLCLELLCGDVFFTILSGRQDIRAELR
jgi:hypothetical protein